MANKRHKRLRDSRDALRLLSELINQRLRNEIDSELARDVGFLLKVFLSAYEQSEILTRIESLEAVGSPKVRVL